MRRNGKGSHCARWKMPISQCSSHYACTQSEDEKMRRWQLTVLATHGQSGGQRRWCQCFRRTELRKRLKPGAALGTMPHADVMRAIELLGKEVAPKVRTEIARWEAEQAQA